MQVHRRLRNDCLHQKESPTIRLHVLLGLHFRNAHSRFNGCGLGQLKIPSCSTAILHIVYPFRVVLAHYHGDLLLVRVSEIAITKVRSMVEVAEYIDTTDVAGSIATQESKQDNLRCICD